MHKINGTEPKCCPTAGLPEKVTGAASDRDPRGWDFLLETEGLVQNHHIHQCKHHRTLTPPGINALLHICQSKSWVVWFFGFFSIPWVCPWSLPADFWESKFSKMIKTAFFFSFFLGFFFFPLRTENWVSGFHSFGRWKITAWDSAA